MWCRVNIHNLDGRDVGGIHVIWVMTYHLVLSEPPVFERTLLFFPPKHLFQLYGSLSCKKETLTYASWEEWKPREAMVGAASFDGSPGIAGHMCRTQTLLLHWHEMLTYPYWPETNVLSSSAASAFEKPPGPLLTQEHLGWMRDRKEVRHNPMYTLLVICL